jgi:glycosyltransferase involved in cell wall biosynthesis
MILVKKDLDMQSENNLMVAVYMITYNHELYIAQAIDSVLMQKTNFDFHLFIGEDCSTDDTSNICKDYAEKHPNKITLFAHEQNIGATNNAQIIYKACFESGAKYVAMLEGDDYWTDPYKLQKQVDFLENNSDYTICFHPIKIVKNNIIIDDDINNINETTSIIDLSKGNYIHTVSVVFRNSENFCFPESFKKAPAGDYFLHMINARYGKVKKNNEVMAIYRIHKNGIWSSMTEIKRHKNWINQMDIMIDYFMENREIVENLTRQKENSKRKIRDNFVINKIKHFIKINLYK